MNRQLFESVSDFAVTEGLDRMVVAELERAAVHRVVEKRNVLYAPGEPSDSVFFLASGRVKVSRLTDDGKELILDLLEAGGLFGETGALGMKPRETITETLERASLFVVPASRFRAVVGNEPELLFRLVQLMGLRQRQLEKQLLDVAYKSAPKRLASLLLRLGESYGVRDARGIFLSIKLSQAALGNLLGVSREMVNVTLSELKRRDVIVLTGGRVVIRKPRALAALAT